MLQGEKIPNISSEVFGPSYNTRVWFYFEKESHMTFHFCMLIFA